MKRGEKIPVVQFQDSMLLGKMYDPHRSLQDGQVIQGTHRLSVYCYDDMFLAVTFTHMAGREKTYTQLIPWSQVTGVFYDGTFEESDDKPTAKRADKPVK